VQSPVAGIFTADLHFSEKPPVARSGEKDWMRVQMDFVDELRDIQVANKMAPIFIAGDLLQSWKVSPYMLSSLIGWFRGMEVYAIAGNHDLPDHNYMQLPRSGYWTLVEAGAIKHMSPGGTYSIGSITIHPFPHGVTVLPPNKPETSLCLQVALIHDYIWIKDKGHYDAPEAHRYTKWSKKLQGYDVAFFGDNHIPFTVKGADQCCPVVNCGVPLRRHNDEQQLIPSVVLLRSNGQTQRLTLQSDKEGVWLDLDQEITNLEGVLEMDLSQFAEELSDLKTEQLSYAKTVLKWVKGKDVPERVKEIILRCLSRTKVDYRADNKRT
jgi:predicted phosphodiesterase